MSTVIGLTGPTGAGKSSVTDIAVNLGFKVIDCDKLARVAVNKGSRGLAALRNAFGDDVITPEGILDRARLAQIAFSEEKKTELLNKTLLPFICELVDEQIDTEYVLLDAPTLFESGMNSICKQTVAVLAPVEIRLKRIMERDKITVEAALLRINAGKPDEFYIKKADKVFYNNGELSDFQSTINVYLKEITGGK